MKGQARYTYYIEEDHARIEIIANLNIVKNILVDLDKIAELRQQEFSFSFKGKYVVYYTKTIKPSILAYYILGIDKPYIRFKYRNGNMYDLRKKNIIVSEKIEPLEKISKVKGVSWNANAFKWEARVFRKKTTHYLGVFDDENKAISAVIAKRIELHTSQLR